ncbi:hypothetical protein D0817_25360, partial [Flavobacterium cupreum]
ALVHVLELALQLDHIVLHDADRIDLDEHLGDLAHHAHVHVLAEAPEALVGDDEAEHDGDHAERDRGDRVLQQGDDVRQRLVKQIARAPDQGHAENLAGNALGALPEALRFEILRSVLDHVDILCWGWGGR